MEKNLCGVLVHAKPGNSAAIRARLEAFPGVEVHGGDGEGKLIVTVEDTQQSPAADTMMAFNNIEGVLNAILIYHYGGDDFDEEVPGEVN